MNNGNETSPFTNNTNPLKVIVIGATGGTGRATVDRLLEHGHRVTAFCRSARKLADLAGKIRVVAGDATLPEDLDAAVAGQDVVIVTLGISENPFRVRLFGPKWTPADVQSAGTRNVIAAMRRQGVRRLIVQSSFGVGDSRDKLGDRLFFKLVLEPQIADTEVQEAAVKSSGLDWVLVQPVHLTDAPAVHASFASSSSEVRGSKISRATVAEFMAREAAANGHAGRSVALSAQAAPALSVGSSKAVEDAECFNR